MSTETLAEYKERVYKVAKRVKREEDWREEGFQRVMRELDLVPDVPEPTPGSVVLHPYSSIVWIRSWGGTWRISDKQRPEGSVETTWEEIVKRCQGRPTVLLNTNGKIGYSSLDGGITL